MRSREQAIEEGGLVPELPRHHSTAWKPGSDVARVERALNAETIPKPPSERAWRAYIVDGKVDTREFLRAKVQTRGQDTSASAGGYTVPDGPRDSIYRSIRNVSPMVTHSTVRRTDRGEQITVATTTDAVVGGLVAEGVQDTIDDITFGGAVFDAFTFRSGPVVSSIELLQDTGANLDTEVYSISAARLGRAINLYATVGTGSSQPNGITVAATDSTITPTAAAGATLANGDSIMAALPDIHHASASWMTGTDGLAQMAALDTTARPSAFFYRNDGTPMFLGHPVVTNTDMPAVANGARSLIFGDLSAYGVRLVGRPTLLRVTETYAEKLQVGFIAFQRADGEILNADALVYAQYTT